MKKIAVVYAVLSFVVVAAFGQVNSGLLTTLSAVAGMRDRFPVEKVYLQLDKPYYSLGDTLRFKAYLLNGDFLKPSLKSGLIYVELYNVMTGRTLIRVSVPVTAGTGHGDIPLDDKEITEGSYILRACTNWMLNFGEDYVFKKSISISSVSGSSTLVKAAYKIEDEAGKDKISAVVQLTGLDGEPMRLRDMRLRISKGWNWLFNDKVNTGMDGRMHLSFNLADKTALNKLYMQIQNIGKGADTATLTIPVVLNRPEKTDVQYLPEGGNLVAGIATKIGFKAIGEDGRSTNIAGKIVNSKQREVATFQSTYKGMGTFELIPQAGESYTAKVNAPNNITISYPLPVVNPTGTALKIVPKGNDSLEVTLSATTDLLNATSNYYLIGETRGMVCYTALIGFKNSVVKKVVAKDLFPAGIAHFTLLNSTHQALNERIVYIAHNENLHINLTANKPDYALRDSIAVAIAVKDKNGKPVRGNFSLAVTDGSQVSTDSLNNNIISNLLLTSDLKGNVEEPGWYFQKDTPERITALDNLLLTQGWVGYDWKAIFNPIIQQPKYRAEKEFIIQGTLTNIFNKPLKQTHVALLQKQPLVVKDVLTDDEGRFIFKGNDLVPTDTAFYMIEAKRKNGENKDFNIGIDLDEYNPPVYTQPQARQMPWYFNTDTTLLNNANTKIAQLKAEAGIIGGGHQLKEVIIKSTKIIPKSQNLNGPGGADVILDEKDMNKAKNLSLFELLQQKFPDFHKIQIGPGITYYLDYRGNTISDLRIDGVFISEVRVRKDVMMENLKASDIRGIELMRSGEFAMVYAEAHRPQPWIYKPGQIYMEITTYSGHGAFLNHTPGRFIYRPIPFTLAAKFYSPKYTVKNRNMAMGTDLRSTIFWQPNLITDKDGKATVSFYSADRVADYTLILEGTDMNGSFGYSRQKIKVAVKR